MKLLLLFGFLAVAWAQEELHCHCIVLATVEDGVVQVHHLPPVDVPDCEDNLDCRLQCDQEWVNLTGDGDLDLVLENGLSMGQESCNSLASQGITDFGPSTLYVYSSQCHGPWLFDGQSSQTPLCCAGGVYTPC